MNNVYVVLLVVVSRKGPVGRNGAANRGLIPPPPDCPLNARGQFAILLHKRCSLAFHIVFAPILLAESPNNYRFENVC